MATKRPNQVPQSPATKFKCPCCDQVLKVAHGEQVACSKCGQTYKNFGNALITLGMASISDYETRTRPIRVVLGGDSSKTRVNWREVRGEPYVQGYGAIQCPRCASVMPCPEHGADATCENCKLRVRTRGAMLEFEVCLLLSDYMVP